MNLHISTPYLNHHNTHIAIIEGNTCITIEDFYNQVVHQLSVPDYFGRNLDAFEEIVNDLSWITTNNCWIIITNTDIFLKNDPYKADVLDILNQIEDNRVEVFCLNSNDIC